MTAYILHIGRLPSPPLNANESSLCFIDEIFNFACLRSDNDKIKLALLQQAGLCLTPLIKKEKERKKNNEKRSPCTWLVLSQYNYNIVVGSRLYWWLSNIWQWLQGGLKDFMTHSTFQWNFTSLYTIIE